MDSSLHQRRTLHPAFLATSTHASASTGRDRSNSNASSSKVIKQLLKVLLILPLFYFCGRLYHGIFQRSEVHRTSRDVSPTDEELVKEHSQRNIRSGMIHMINSTNAAHSTAKLPTFDKSSWLIGLTESSQRTRVPYKKFCRFHSCLELCKSSDRLKIYLYPLHGSQSYSHQFLEIYYSVLHSEFYEEDPTEACIFFPSVDLLVPSEDKVNFLYRLKFFKTPDEERFGQNHLLVTEDAAALQSYPLGYSVIAAPSFQMANYRSMYDIAIGSFNYAHLADNLSRKDNICYVNSVPEIQAALSINCMPGLLNNEIILPLHPMIDFDSFLLRANKKEHILMPKNPAQIDVLEKRGKNVYDYYFSNANRIVLSAIGLLQERMFPDRARAAREWNKIAHNQGMHSNVPYQERSPIFGTQVAPDAGFTCIVLAYDRIESLFQVIERVAQSDNLKKMIVVWNNQVKQPPTEDQWPKIRAKLVVIKMDRNVLSNRFFPFAEIQTEAVLAIDDDIVMLTKDELDFAYHVWREYPDRIVGFPSRLHLWAEENPEKLKYESEWRNEISMVLTGVAFYHAYYNHVYTYQAPKPAIEFVDQSLNCEDILFNFVVANATHKAPIKVTPRKKFKCTDCGAGLSGGQAVDPSHIVERSSCLNKFHQIYGKMPLKTVIYRADPVLYKDDVDVSQKRFSDMGDL